MRGLVPSLFAASLLASSVAHAQAQGLDTPSGQQRLEDLEAKVEALELQLSQVQQLTPAPPRSPITFHGYVDVGFFWPIGNGGAGYIQDFGNQTFPQFKGQYGWVFLGDLLATTVNSRGEVADLGNAPGVTRFDSIHSGGAPGFIINEANFRMNIALGDSTLVTTSFNLVPRTGSDFTLGDFFDLDLAQLEWMPTDDRKISIFVGKIESVLGIEYKERKADHRFGITPSLIARYTTGTALGLKARGKFFDDHLVVALAVTNGTNTWEQFHFYNEVDTNAGKTASGRISVRIPFPGELEIGVSGMVGPQDRAFDNAHLIWFAGADLQLVWRDLTVKAQYLRGGAPGDGGQGVYGLNLNNGAYLEADYMIIPWLGVMARGELRDALVFLGTERAYLTKGWRVTGGLRVVFSENIVLKAEYLHNGEYGGIPQIKNDVFTSSLVLAY
jgi:hypothetical protein